MADYKMRLQIEPEDPGPTESDFHEAAEELIGDAEHIEVDTTRITYQDGDKQVVAAVIYVPLSAIPR